MCKFEVEVEGRHELVRFGEQRAVPVSKLFASLPVHSLPRVFEAIDPP
jgi:hypothetical protein